VPAAPYVWMVGEAKIIVGAKIDHLPLAGSRIDHHPAALRTGNLALALIETARLDLFQLARKVGQEIRTHRRSPIIV